MKMLFTTSNIASLITSSYQPGKFLLDKGNAKAWD